LEVAVLEVPLTAGVAAFPAERGAREAAFTDDDEVVVSSLTLAALGAEVGCGLCGGALRRWTVRRK